MTAYLNLLEPETLVHSFLADPPENARAFIAPGGTPAFSTRFDLLTTADDRLRRGVATLPFYRHWSRVLKPVTCFVGTTVSEYALFPREFSAAILVREIRDGLARDYSFVIIKDIPQDSPLLEADTNARAHEVVEACQAAGFVLLEGQALAYVPIDFDSVDEFVSKLPPGRRRDIRRKLRSRVSLSIEVAIVQCGDDRFRRHEVLDEYYQLYMNVFRQSEVHFDLLRAEFFRSVLQDGSSGGIVFEYRQHGRLIGYNLCFVCGTMLIDKYVGFRYPEAREANLYFVSWFHNLAFARERGLKYYVAGWTDPEVKSYLGAQFTFTRHAVYVRNRVLRAGLRRLAGYFERDRAWREGNSVASSRRS
jgi:predicted N-acyltransferase